MGLSREGFFPLEQGGGLALQSWGLVPENGERRSAERTELT